MWWLQHHTVRPDPVSLRHPPDPASCFPQPGAAGAFAWLRLGTCHVPGGSASRSLGSLPPGTGNQPGGSARQDRQELSGSAGHCQAGPEPVRLWGGQTRYARGHKGCPPPSLVPGSFLTQNSAGGQPSGLVATDHWWHQLNTMGVQAQGPPAAPRDAPRQQQPLDAGLAAARSTRPGWAAPMGAPANQ